MGVIVADAASILNVVVAVIKSGTLVSLGYLKIWQATATGP